MKVNGHQHQRGMYQVGVIKTMATKKNSDVIPEEAVAGSVGGQTDELGNISQVRDILFGSKSREIDGKISRLEARIDDDIRSLEEETRKRFDSLEKVIRSELSSLADRLSAEQNERVENIKKLDVTIQEKAENAERRVSQANDTIAKAERTLRELFLDQVKTLRDELQHTNTKFRSHMDAELTDVRRTKLDSEGLSELFREFSVRLTDELQDD